MRNPLFEITSEKGTAHTNQEGKTYRIILLEIPTKQLKLDAGQFKIHRPHITIFEEQAADEQQHSKFSCYHGTITLESTDNQQLCSVRTYFDRSGNVLSTTAKDDTGSALTLNDADCVTVQNLILNATLAFASSHIKILHNRATKLQQDINAGFENAANLIANLSNEAAAQLPCFKLYLAAVEKLTKLSRELRLVSVNYNETSRKFLPKLEEATQKKIAYLEAKIASESTKQHETKVSTSPQVNPTAPQAVKQDTEYKKKMKQLNRKLGKIGRREKSDDKNSLLANLQLLTQKFDLIQSNDLNGLLTLLRSIDNAHAAIQCYLTKNAGQLTLEELTKFLAFDGVNSLEAIASVAKHDCPDKFKLILTKAKLLPINLPFFPYKVAGKAEIRVDLLVLIYAAKKPNMLEMIETALIHGITPNCIAGFCQANINVDTLLMLAVKEGNQRLAKLLVKHGADVNIAQSRGNIMMASLSRNPEENRQGASMYGKIQNLFERSGVAANKLTALHIACKKLDYAVIKILLTSRSVNVNIKNTQKYDALGLLCLQIGENKIPNDQFSEYAEVIDLLIAKGADVDAPQAADGASALYFAAEFGALLLLQKLISLHADINFQAFNPSAKCNISVLIIAYYKQHVDVFKELISNPNICISTNDIVSISRIPIRDKAKCEKMLGDLKNYLEEKNRMEEKDFLITRKFNLLSKAGFAKLDSQATKTCNLTPNVKVVDLPPNDSELEEQKLSATPG